MYAPRVQTPRVLLTRPWSPQKNDKQPTQPASYAYGSRVEKPHSLVARPLTIHPSDEPLTKPVPFPFETAYDNPYVEDRFYNPPPAYVPPSPGTIRTPDAIHDDIAYIERDLIERDRLRMGRKRIGSLAQWNAHELADRKYEMEALNFQLPALKQELAASMQIQQETSMRRRTNAAQAMIAAAAQEKRATEGVYFRSYGEYSYAAAHRSERVPELSPQEVTQYQASAAKTLFRQMDKNSDGQLTHREIKKYLQANEAAKRLLTRPGEEWSEIWKKMDSDPRNHLIDEAEFVNYYLSKCDE